MPPLGPGQKTMLVGAGMSLAVIAARFPGTTPQDLIDMNPQLAAPGTLGTEELYAGETIIVPSDAGAQPVVEATSSTSTNQPVSNGSNGNKPRGGHIKEDDCSLGRPTDRTNRHRK